MAGLRRRRMREAVQAARDAFPDGQTVYATTEFVDHADGWLGLHLTPAGARGFARLLGNAFEWPLPGAEPKPEEPKAAAIVKLTLEATPPQAKGWPTIAAGAHTKLLGVDMSTISRPFLSPEEFRNPNIVKVVTNTRGDALYFSRAPIPYIRQEAVEASGKRRARRAGRRLGGAGARRGLHPGRAGRPRDDRAAPWLTAATRSG